MRPDQDRNRQHDGEEQPQYLAVKPPILRERMQLLIAAALLVAVVIMIIEWQW
ncbi:hypothetical protein [Paenibacillus wulumuqiensis]|uniref:hypothetical protein n=1 Tax=Paenibacillus wulumuqiensis TaxID=1567107 RepID=UPI000A92AF66|nr:hypothetical protein [Paenibacillus wulumuqiensis]